jgi:hypothetical protein
MASTANVLAPVLTPEGWELLNSLEPYAEAESLRLATELRRAGHPAELVAAALTQSRLRARATGKFGEFAARMLFTPAGLEQATRLSVAARHAERYATAGLKRVADLGCGVGADSMALATLGREVTAIEIDETTAAAATVNLMPWSNATVVNADVASIDISAYDGVWLDPARRATSSSGTSRIFDPEAFSPPLSFVEQLADTGKPVGVKLGPGIPHSAVPAGCEAQWVSVGGEVAEVALWFNALKREGVRRSALVIGSGGAAELNSAADFDASEDVPLGAPAGYLYEPDGAVIRARLVADVVHQVGGHLLDPQIAYFCAPELVETPFARAYRVLEVMPYNVRALRAWVRTNGIGVLDIKKRGASTTPEELRRQLLTGAPKGSRGRATLVLTRIGDERVAIAVEPVPGQPVTE